MHYLYLAIESFTSTHILSLKAQHGQAQIHWGIEVLAVVHLIVNHDRDMGGMEIEQIM